MSMAFGPPVRENGRLLLRPQSISLDLDCIAEVRNLIKAFRRCAAQNGKAPGIDRMRYTDVGSSELAGILRALRRDVLDGTYRPGAIRRVQIPKPDGSGVRTLAIRPIIDRVLSSACSFPLTRRSETQLLPQNHGYRPHHSHLTCLADLAILIERHHITAMVQDDVVDAFGQVNVEEAIDGFRRLGADESLGSISKKLIEVSCDDPRGICQGDPLSPLALNMILHNIHDEPLSRLNPNTRWLRYADNLAYLGHNVTEASDLYDHGSALVSGGGFRLKRGQRNGGYGQPIDLTSDRVEWLGFSLDIHNRHVRVSMHSNSWDALDQLLLSAHDSPNPCQSARSATAGWIASRAPALRRRRSQDVQRIRATMARASFHELAQEQWIVRHIDRARERWISIVDVARNRDTSCSV